MKFQRLKDEREDHDMTQEDIAKLLFTTKQQYSLYETGQREIPVHHLITLADFYGCSIDYLVSIREK